MQQIEYKRVLYKRGCQCHAAHLCYFSPPIFRISNPFYFPFHKQSVCILALLAFLISRTPDLLCFLTFFISLHLFNFCLLCLYFHNYSVVLFLRKTYSYHSGIFWRKIPNLLGLINLLTLALPS